MASFYDFSVKDIKRNETSLKEYAGKVVLVVNVASKCGYTRQYEGLQKIWTEHKDKGTAHHETQRGEAGSERARVGFGFGEGAGGGGVGEGAGGGARAGEKRGHAGGLYRIRARGMSGRRERCREGTVAGKEARWVDGAGREGSKQPGKGWQEVEMRKFAEVNMGTR